ncbi:hypothetical protein CCP3SC15_1360010 [Gammaproteobacteria bacterium]
MERYRPRLVITEINEKIPPPLKFAVLYREGVAPPGGDLYGMSLTMANDLMVRHDYRLIDFNYNNAYFVPATQPGFTTLTPEEAYASGYKDRAERQRIFSYNAPFAPLLDLDPPQALNWVRKYWEHAADHFLLSY